MFCNGPGHYAAGMYGTLTVTEWACGSPGRPPSADRVFAQIVPGEAVGGALRPPFVRTADSRSSTVKPPRASLSVA